MDEYLQVAGPEAELSETDRIAATSAAPQAAAAVVRDPAAGQKARDFIQGLGGARNVSKVEAVAGTRLRVVVGDDKRVSEPGLAQAGVDAVMRLPNHVVHLIVGPNADQYAAEMSGQLA
jgi:PTS system glucose-specific IIC component